MNLPNRLTVLRLVMTFVFIGLFAIPDTTAHYLIYWRIAFVLSIIAGITDFFDGYLARKYKLETDFGRLMDPLSDKIFVVALFVVLSENHVVPGWITSLVLAREFAVTGLRQMAADAGAIVHVSYLGKFKTTLQMITLAVGGLILIKWAPVGVRLFDFAWYAMVGAMAFVTVYTGVDYFVRNRRLYLDKM